MDIEEGLNPSTDIAVGEMIEGLYSWNEYCPEHAKSFLNIYPDRQHRGISIFEVTSSWREYRCYACSKLLWNRGPATPNTARRATSTGHTVFQGTTKKEETAA
jgi:hypothetical protein